MTTRSRLEPVRRSVAGHWALIGIALLLGKAVMRLGWRGWIVLSDGVTAFQGFVAVLLVGAFLYGEGMLALERRWVPSLLHRVDRLPDEGNRWNRLGAPLYAMSLIGAPAKTLVRAWAGVGAIVVAVLVVRALPDPWRAMIDLAVAAALAWGLLALVRAVVRSYSN